LDPDWGDYPYVTSSHCGVAAALLNGVNPRSLRNVWGVAKIYETYVGKKHFQPKNPVFNQIQQIGSEYGATTGRVRQCNWLDWSQLEQAILMNGVNKLIFNKMDVLREVGRWQINNPNLKFEAKKRLWNIFALSSLLC
jgi:adenylosuccinate synthase